MSEERVETFLTRMRANYEPPKAPGTNGKHATDDVIVFGPECRLPDTFWNVETDGPLGRRLRHIRDSAHAVQRSPTAAFGVGLSRMSAGISHTIKLDGTVGTEQPLIIFVATVGASGAGKGDGAAIASRNFPNANLPLLIEGITDHLPPGSGQGLIDVLFDLVEEHVEGRKAPVKRKMQARNNAFFEMDEGEALGALAGSDSSIVLESLRTIWSGKTVGQVNVEAERRRVLPAGTYTYGVNIQVQPTKAAELIEDDAGGTPQRFLWFAVTDPDIPAATGERFGPCDWGPPDKGELAKVVVHGEGGYERHYMTQDPAIAAEIRAYDLGVQRGEIVLAPLDAHALNLRRRVAALLALLDGTFHVSLLHWELSATVMAVSNATRAVVLGATAKVKGDKADADRAFKSSVIAAGGAASRLTHVVEVATKIAVKVHAEPERWTYASMRRNGISKAAREVYVDAIDHAEEMRWIVVDKEPGQGGDKRQLRPGKKKP